VTKRRLDYGVPRQGCMHADRLLLLPPSFMSVNDGGQGPILNCGAAEWCRECGAIRFGLRGHFVVPRRARAR
jgi:hypothetical protein